MKTAFQSVPVVLITGALAGIGRATAVVFAQEGARVVVSGRREEEGRKLESNLRKLGAEAEFFRAEVRHENDVRNLVDQIVQRFGRLDVAVNNAGTEGKTGPITEQSPESYAATFDTNVLGVLLCMKHELRAMSAQKNGNIVNISSTFGRIGAAGAALYVASKHAVEGLTKSAALEGAPFGVRVNAVAPEPVETEMLSRFAGSDERKATFLSPESDLSDTSRLWGEHPIFAIGSALYHAGSRKWSSSRAPRLVFEYFCSWSPR
jgi:NAD(P)-dependent dehydrogenase (short-subunit alcohol dehydrogenase family)